MKVRQELESLVMQACKADHVVKQFLSAVDFADCRLDSSSVSRANLLRSFKLRYEHNLREGRVITGGADLIHNIHASTSEIVMMINVYQGEEVICHLIYNPDLTALLGSIFFRQGKVMYEAGDTTSDSTH